MPIQTPQEYYEDPSLWGGYRYVTFKDVIDELLLETTDPAGYLANTHRSRLLVKCKNGIRHLSREVKKTVHAYEITVSPKLWIPLPQNYIDWVRVSLVDDEFTLKPLRVNYSIPTAVSYLQDHQYEILYDHNGQILMADGINFYNKPHKKKKLCRGCNANGEFNIDTDRGVIAFSSDLEDKEIVIEYLSDGLDLENLSEKEIKVHKDIKETLMAYVYYHTIAHRRPEAVPFNEKQRALARYKALLHRAKMHDMKFNFTEVGEAI